MSILCEVDYDFHGILDKVNITFFVRNKEMNIFLLISMSDASQF
jgi:hypothetical protein